MYNMSRVDIVIDAKENLGCSRDKNLSIYSDAFTERNACQTMLQNEHL